MAIRDLDQTEKAVFYFILKYKEEHDGNSPALRDIVEYTSVKSTSHAVNVLDRLMRKGRLEVVEGIARGIEVVGGKWRYDG